MLFTSLAYKSILKMEALWSFETSIYTASFNRLFINSVVFSPLANYTDRSSDRRRSAKLVSTLADRGCHVVSATSPFDRNFDSLDLEPLLFLPSSSSNCSRG
jgi:hypothetical protein